MGTAVFGRESSVTKKQAISRVRALMADAAELQSRAPYAAVRGGEMLMDATRYERQAWHLAATFNLGDPRYV